MRRDLWSVLGYLLASLVVAGCGGGAGGDENRAPTAEAGHDRIVTRNSRVILDGSASFDPDGDVIGYSWTVNSRPIGSTATISSPNRVGPTFVPDLAGSYVLSLVVSDGKVSSAPDSVSIRALSTESHLNDTGQTRCYGATSEMACPAVDARFYGQDAQYGSNPMELLDDGTTVTDVVTGLVWQRSDSERTYNWFQAAGVYDATYNPTSVDVCGALGIGGHSDWRLPSRREWISILDYAQDAPDPDHFPASGSEYWTSSGTAVGGDVAWGAEGGVLTYGFGRKGTSGRHVRCVRGTPWGRNAFFDIGDGTVRDGMSGLTWQKTDDGVARTWEEALAYCESLTLAGSPDWRLPDIRELESLVYLGASDTTPSNPAVDSRFPATRSASYWSSTSFVAPDVSSSFAWGVDFSFGWVSWSSTRKDGYYFTRCVR